MEDSILWINFGIILISGIVIPILYANPEINFTDSWMKGVYLCLALCSIVLNIYFYLSFPDDFLIFRVAIVIIVEITIIVIFPFLLERS